MLYYELPLKPSSLFQKNEHKFCHLKDSIAHHIHLLNTTHFGECSFDETFGCAIWEIDFDNLKSVNKLKNLIIESLEESLKRHEKRLTNIKVEVNINQEEISTEFDPNRIKKKIDLKIFGTIKSTNENFSYSEYFFIGPLSY